MRAQTQQRQDLPERLMAAFARLDPKTPVPDWPRSVRIGVDYSLYASGMLNPENDDDADAAAHICFILGHLQKRDPPGDPPATCAAHDHADKAGADYGRAFSLLGTIRDGSADLARAGEPVPCLPKPAMRVLQRAARGELVKQALLIETLAAAETLARQLTDRVLCKPPGGG